jgi:hypothetical protein
VEHQGLVTQASCVTVLRTLAKHGVDVAAGAWAGVRTQHGLGPFRAVQGRRCNRKKDKCGEEKITAFQIIILS